MELFQELSAVTQNKDNDPRYVGVKKIVVSIIGDKYRQEINEELFDICYQKERQSHFGLIGQQFHRH